MRKNIKEVIKEKYEELEEELINCDESDIRAIVHCGECRRRIAKVTDIERDGLEIEL